MTENPFLREVIEHPDDDEVRLIYADFLEEQGDPRGEFIRVQCELDKMPLYDPRRQDLLSHSTQLLRDHESQWAEELQQDVKKISFRRGFIATVTVLARRFAAEGDSLFDSTPIDWLRLNRLGGAGERLAESDALLRLRRLDLCGLRIPIDDLTAVLKSPKLQNLVGLNLNYAATSYSSDLGEALVQSAMRESLEHLELLDAMTHPLLVGLSSGEGFPALRHLAIGAEQGSAQSWSRIADIPLPRLESLRLRGKLLVDSCQHISRMNLSQLKHINLSGTGAPAAGLESLREAGAFTKAAVVNLTNCPMRQKAAPIVFRENELLQCRSLAVGDPKATAEGFEDEPLLEGLSQHPLPRLEELVYSRLGPGMLAHLARLPQLQNLKSLSLPGGIINAYDIQSISDSAWTESLLSFEQHRGAMTVDAMALLRDSAGSSALGPGLPVFKNLIRLDLSQIGTHFDATIETVADQHRVRVWLQCGLPSLQLLKFSPLSGSSLDAFNDTLRQIANTNLPELRHIHAGGGRAPIEAIQATLASPNLPRLKQITLWRHTNKKLASMNLDERLVFI